MNFKRMVNLFMQKQRKIKFFAVLFAIIRCRMMQRKKKFVQNVKKTLTGTQEHVKTLLKQNNLDIYIDLLEEKKLLALPALSKMKKKEYQRIGIDENDIKKFVKIFSKKKDIGCIIALSVIAAVVLGILIFLVSNFGFKIGFLIFILLPGILWLWEDLFG